MSIPAGSIITVAGRSIIDRLQDAGLQDPRVPVETVRETGNDLVVGKVLTEADFNFQLTSWDVGCDLMALINGKLGDISANHGPSFADAVGTKYRWDTAQFINLASPYKSDTGVQGGDITSGVIVPAYYPTALSYRLGVTDNAQMQVTLNGGAFFMSEAYPIEETATGDGATVAYVTGEPARVLRIGGPTSTNYQHVFGVLVNGVIQIRGVDYEESGGADPEAVGGMTAVTITFTVPPPAGAQVRWSYFTTTHHALPQAVHAPTSQKPAAVRGRDITLILGPPGGTQTVLHGLQTFELQASCQSTVSREMGNYDPIGRSIQGVDTNGTVTLEPKDSSSFYAALSEMTGVDRSEVLGYINQFPVPLQAIIHDPKTGNVIKSIYVDDAIFQAPGSSVRVNQPTQYPIRWESLNGTFREIKGRAAIAGD